MAVERLELPEDEWADLERRPAHGIIRKIARDIARASKNDPLGGEDVLVLALVKAWEVHDGDGNVVTFDKANFDKVPQDTWSTIVDECSSIIEDAVPNPQPRGR
jgi:hypothetical protein